MTELEKKILLTEEEYYYLMEHLGHDSPLLPKPIVKQINYYFDTDDLSMNRQNTTCRIRLKDGKYNATMKTHSKIGEQSTETEIDVRDGIRDNAFIDMGLKLQGELTTHRCIVLKDKNCEVVLDKNEYLGTFDYELEIEYLPEYEKDAQAIYQVILDMLTRRKCFLAYKEGYERNSNVPSKSNRFFERKSTMDEKKNVSSSYIASDANDLADTSHETQDPDEYLNEFFYPREYNKSVCFSCIHWNGTICDADYGKCEYEHY